MAPTSERHKPKIVDKSKEEIGLRAEMMEIEEADERYKGVDKWM
jgi:hypothetical protein